MTCYHPNTAHVSGTRETGTKIIKFGLPKSIGLETFELPCGQCIGCRLDYSQMWAIRSMHEAQQHDNNCFITLTYNDENLPYDGSLIPNHPRQFIKRLRRAIGPLRYLLCGEYGPSVGKRPHYHALIFGQDMPDRELFAENEGLLTHTSELLSKIWGKGFTTVADLTIETAAYVARYNLKKITPSQQKEELYAHYETICQTTGEVRQLQPEYANMSTRPGLARDWYDRFNKDIFPHDSTIYKGRNIKTPRYYENLLRSSDEDLYDSIKAKRRQKAIKNASNNTPSRLRVREIITQRKLSDNFTRTLHNDS